jgi:hypothetical protein
MGKTLSFFFKNDDSPSVLRAAVSFPDRCSRNRVGPPSLLFPVKIQGLQEKMQFNAKAASCLCRAIIVNSHQKNINENN